MSDNSQCLSTVNTVLCSRESDAKTDERHISITPTKGSDWVQPWTTFSPCLLQWGNPWSGEWRKPKLMCVLSFLHRDAALEKGWTPHAAAAQQLQVLAEDFSNLNHHEIPGQRKRQAVLHLQWHYCIDVKCYSESPILISHSFCSWSFCSTLKEALGCLDTCLSSQMLLE